MIRLRLQDVAELLGVDPPPTDATIAGIETDTRRLAHDMLFVALRGERFDGHDYLPAAADAGAAAALVERRSSETALPQIVVDDTRRALGRLANAWRRRHRGVRVVGITGSNGKTTVRRMVTAILSREGPCLESAANFNNDIGVPLTLFRLTGEHRFAVVEMGANHAGEIAGLADIAEPDVGVVTNAGPAHLEGFGSVDGVARAKGELFEALGADGTAVVNADGDYTELWRQLAGEARVLQFGERQPAEVSAAAVQPRAAGGYYFELRCPAGSVPVAMPLAGRHNVANALAAAAAAVALGVSATTIADGLASVTPVPGRLSLQSTPGGWQLLDDSYNANPASLEAGLATLAEHPGERWLLLGDMAELGSEAALLHRDCGTAARRYGVSRLYAVGSLAAVAAEAFGEGGWVAADVDELIARVRAELHAGVRCLVKGSRRAGMERVVGALAAEPAAEREGG